MQRTDFHRLVQMEIRKKAAERGRSFPEPYRRRAAAEAAHIAGREARREVRKGIPGHPPHERLPSRPGSAAKGTTRVVHRRTHAAPLPHSALPGRFPPHGTADAAPRGARRESRPGTAENGVVSASGAISLLIGGCRKAAGKTGTGSRSRGRAKVRRKRRICARTPRRRRHRRRHAKSA